MKSFNSKISKNIDKEALSRDIQESFIRGQTILLKFLKAIIFAGNSRMGKSTLACLLANLKMVKDYDPETGFVRVSPEDLKHKDKVLHEKYSITQTPNIFETTLNGENYSIIDLPGFKDSSCIKEAVNLHYTKSVLNRCEEGLLVLVIKVHEDIVVQSQEIALINRFYEMFPQQKHNTVVILNFVSNKSKLNNEEIKRRVRQDILKKAQTEKRNQAEEFFSDILKSENMLIIKQATKEGRYFTCPDLTAFIENSLTTKMAKIQEINFKLDLNKHYTNSLELKQTLQILTKKSIEWINQQSTKLKELIASQLITYEKTWLSSEIQAVDNESEIQEKYFLESNLKNIDRNEWEKRCQNERQKHLETELQFVKDFNFHKANSIEEHRVKCMSHLYSVIDIDKVGKITVTDNMREENIGYLLRQLGKTLNQIITITISLYEVIHPPRNSHNFDQVGSNTHLEGVRAKLYHTMVYTQTQIKLLEFINQNIVDFRFQDDADQEQHLVQDDHLTLKKIFQDDLYDSFDPLSMIGTNNRAKIKNYFQQLSKQAFTRNIVLSLETLFQAKKVCGQSSFKDIEHKFILLIYLKRAQPIQDFKIDPNLDKTLECWSKIQRKREQQNKLKLTIEQEAKIQMWRKNNFSKESIFTQQILGNDLTQIQNLEKLIAYNQTTKIQNFLKLNKVLSLIGQKQKDWVLLHEKVMANYFKIGSCHQELIELIEQIYKDFQKAIDTDQSEDPNSEQKIKDEKQTICNLFFKGGQYFLNCCRFNNAQRCFELIIVLSRFEGELQNLKEIAENYYLQSVDPEIQLKKISDWKQNHQQKSMISDEEYEKLKGLVEKQLKKRMKDQNNPNKVKQKHLHIDTQNLSDDSPTPGSQNTIRPKQGLQTPRDNSPTNRKKPFRGGFITPGQFETPTGNRALETPTGNRALETPTGNNNHSFFQTPRGNRVIPSEQQKQKPMKKKVRKV